MCLYCDWSTTLLYSGQVDTAITRCNGIKDCKNTDIDEEYCVSMDKTEFYKCKSYGTRILSSEVCNGKCDRVYCEDEWQCNGFTYHYWYTCSKNKRTIASYWICDNSTNCWRERYDERNCGDKTCIRESESTYTYLLANYSRCTPWVCCANKLDQVNCSDTTLAPLVYPIQGHMSTVSQHIICKPIVLTFLNYAHSNSSAVCDDGMDVQCVTLVPGCFIHKHQLCNNINDCEGGSDEKSALC